jgi:hypothetical protein
MSPTARENISKILSKAPEDSDLGALFPQDSRSVEARRREHFMIAAYWADIIRDRNFPMRYKYHQGNWHYSNIFWREENGTAKIIDNPGGEDPGKAIEKLFEMDRTMRDAAVPDPEKAIAIAWFLHLAGDIHQPLHSSARVTDLEPKGDRGANLFLLSPKDAKGENALNLHWFWDSIVNRVDERRNDDADSAFLPPIAQRWMKKYPFERYRSRLNPGKFDSWQQEAIAIAMRDVFPVTLKREQLPSPGYVKSAYRISEEQITLAGYRMGEMLEEIFGRLGPVPDTASVNPPCRIIRRVPFPVSKTRSPDTRLEIALLDLCPPNRGMVARPMTGMIIDGKSAMFEYDVIRVFKDEKEARDFAAQNNIKDIGF